MKNIKLNNPTQKTTKTIETITGSKSSDLSAGNVRISYVVRAETRDRLKAFQYTTRQRSCEVLDKIINAAIDAWEAEGNELLYPPEGWKNK